MLKKLTLSMFAVFISTFVLITQADAENSGPVFSGGSVSVTEASIGQVFTVQFDVAVSTALTAVSVSATNPSGDLVFLTGTCGTTPACSRISGDQLRGGYRFSSAFPASAKSGCYQIYVAAVGDGITKRELVGAIGVGVPYVSCVTTVNPTTTSTALAQKDIAGTSCVKAGAKAKVGKRYTHVPKLARSAFGKSLHELAASY